MCSDEISIAWFLEQTELFITFIQFYLYCQSSIDLVCITDVSEVREKSLSSIAGFCHLQIYLQIYAFEIHSSVLEHYFTA